MIKVRPFLAAALALALSLLPLWHAQGHVDELARTGPGWLALPGSAEAWQAAVPLQGHDCDVCRVLGTNRLEGSAPARALPLGAAPAVGALVAVLPARAIVFVCFDHRGPPLLSV